MDADVRGRRCQRGTLLLVNHPFKQVFLLLILLEVALLSSAFYLGVHVRFGGDAEQLDAGLGLLWPRAVVFVGVLMLCMVAMGLYNRRTRDALPGVLVRLGLSFAVAVVALSVVFYLVPDLLVGRGALALSMLIAFLFVVMTRMFFLDLLEQRDINRRILVLGVGRRAAPLAKLRRKSDLIGFQIVGFLPSLKEVSAVPAHRLIQSDEPLPELVRRLKIDLIIVAVEDRRGVLPIADLLECRTRGVQVVDLMSFLEQETGRINLDIMHPGWLAFASGFRTGVLRSFIKRAFDVAISLTLLIATLPLLLATALAIRLDGSGGPIFYRQLRVGEGGRVFPVYKFRSMRPDAEQDGKPRWAQADDARVTRVGRFIRKYRIDELPQLWNVLRGDMSFVGPRPERPEFVEQLSNSLPYYRERHRVKPGLTGWAQICYPYGASEQDAFEKLQFDLYYVKNHSLLLDLTVLLQTAEVVLWGKGAR